MIIAERKPFDQILDMLKEPSKIALVGCKGCVTVCAAGGRKEVGILAAELKLAYRAKGHEVEVEEITVERQCDKEYIEPIFDTVERNDVVLSMACGAGVQFMAETYPAKHVLPALNTNFIGVNHKGGIWTERCQACGNCKLHLTGGICPVARCSKSLMNGPCGGSVHGKCEIDPDVECGWQLIIDNLKAQGELDRYEEIIGAPDWSSSRDGGPRKIVREDLG